MSDNSHAPKVPKAIVEQLEVHVEGVGERGTGDTPGPSDRDAAEASAQKGSSHMGGDGAQGGAHTSRRDFQRATIGLFEGSVVRHGRMPMLIRMPRCTASSALCWRCLLVIGLWDTIVIAVFVFVGTVIGQMVDGDNAAVNFIRRVLDGRK